MTLAVGFFGGDGEEGAAAVLLAAPTLTFSYQPEPEVLTATPATGPQAGATVVVVGGAGFSDAAATVCRFGRVVVPARFVNGSALSCVAPVHARGEVPLLASNDGVHFFGGHNVSFYFHADALIAAIVPPSGPVDGNTNVTVYGRHLPAFAACVFDGSAPTPTTYVSAVELRCSSPSLPFGAASLRLAPADAENAWAAPAAGATFEAKPTPQLRGLSPAAGPVAGGTIVTVSGANLDPDCACTLDGDDESSPVPARWRSAERLECIVPPAANATRARFTLLCFGGRHRYEGEGDEGEGVTLHFDYYANVTVSALLPPRGPVGGGTRVLLLGAGFVQLGAAAARVRFGEQSVDAVVLNTSAIECEAPPHAGGVVTLQLSLNGVDYDALTTPFRFDNMSVAAVYPQFGQQAGGTLLRIEGEQFSSASPLRCVFGAGLLAPAHYVSPTRLACITPAAAVGIVALTVASDADGHAHSAVSFAFQPAFAVSSIVPALGLANGGTRVVVHGMGFSARAAALGDVQCRFNLTATAARILNESALECVAPPHHSPETATGEHVAGAVPLEVTMNRVDWSDDRVLFTYSEAVCVSAVEPASGPLAGGTRVSVNGINLMATGALRCRFGALSVEATYASAETVACDAPPRDANGDVVVQLSIDGGHAYATSRAVFAYVATPTVLGLSPANGPRDGGTSVAVLGRDFAPSIDLSCRIGGADDAALVRARFVSPSMVNCSMSRHAPGLARVEVSLNGVDFSDDRRSFLYVEPIVLTRATPSLVPIGVPLVVRVTGSGLIPGASCALGSVSSRYASHLSANELLCEFDALDAPGVRRLRVTSNLQDWSESSRLVVAAPLWRALSLAPTLGPERGGTELTVTGTGFERPAGIACRFGGGDTPIAARYINATTIACLTRARAPGNASIEVTANNYDYSRSGLRFQFHADPVVSALLPSYGPVAGGTVVAVSGAHFLARDAALGALLCRFGEAVSPARLVSSQLIECPSSVHAAGGAAFALSLNGGADFVQQPQVNFTFLPVAMHSIQPLVGPERGGTALTIDGFGFSAATPFLCRFAGAVLAPALILSPSRVRCVTPRMAVQQASVSLLHASGTELDVLAEHSFAFQADAVLLALRPIAGPVLGGTLVHLFGAHFSRRSFELGYLHCRFNLTASVATWINDSAVACHAPALLASGADATEGALSSGGPVSVELSNNVIDFTKDSGVTFGYLAESQLAEVEPASGPASGGTLVTVFGNNFASEPGPLLCRFGERTVRALYVSELGLQCTSPPRDGGVNGSLVVELRVSFNGGADFSAAAVQFQYMQTASVRTVSPAEGTWRGGTLVSVEGEGFLNSMLLKCRFGTKVVNAIFVSTQMLNCSTPSHAVTGLAAIEVSNNALHFSSSNVTFLYQDEVHIESLLPRSGPIHGGTNVSVIGRNLLPGSTCRFGELTATRAFWISYSEVICTAPPRAMGAYVVDVTSNTQEFTDSRLNFSYMPPVDVLQLEPELGPSSGGTKVLVRTKVRAVGEGFEPNGGSACRFGDLAPIPARWISEALLECTAPAHVSGSVALEVTANDQDYSASAVLFEYHADVAVHAVLPPHGPVGGGTVVSIEGERFSASAAARGLVGCRFGTLVVPAVFVNTSLLECVSPIQAAGAVSVYVSMNGVEYIDSGHTHLYEAPTVLSLWPFVGPQLGGTALTLEGVNIPAASVLFCRFAGTAITPALRVDSTRAECATPPMVVQNASVSLLLPGQQGNVTDSLADRPFEFQAAAHVSSIFPRRGSVLGGTLVTLRGNAFSRRSAEFGYLRCRFNLTATVATWINDSAIECRAPPHAYADDGAQARAGSLRVEMSNNALDFTADGQAEFRYEAEVGLDKASPASGPSSGGTLVTVIGDGLVDEPGQLLCRFGEIPVSATFISAHKLQCESPPQDADASRATRLSVSIDGGTEFSVAALQFQYTDTVAVHAISPAVGMWRGRTLVSIEGEGFVNSVLLKCRFGTTVVDAIFVSTQMLNCSSPSQPIAGLAAVEVSNNAVDFSSSNVAFLYQEEVLILALTPRSGPVHGGTNVSVIGTHLLNGSMCRFGELAVTRAVWISYFEVVCTAPPLTEGAYTVEVTSNMQEYTDSRLEFSYTPPVDVFKLEPELGPSRGGTKVRVGGENFEPNGGLACRFGDAAPVAARWISEVLLECTAPAHAPGNVTLEVTANDQDYSASAVLFEYYADVAVHAVLPPHGPVGGGTVVSIEGERFSARAAALGYGFCRFGTLAVPAVYVSERLLECLSPANQVGDFALDVSMNGADYTDDGVYYSFMAPSVRALAPALGPERGGTRVRIAASGLPAHNVFCLFGEGLSVRAHVIDEVELSCVTPAAAPGNVSVRVAAQGLWLSTEELSYEYTREAQVLSLSPISGRNSGGYTVIVRGTGFVDRGAADGDVGGGDVSVTGDGLAGAVCRFGQVSVPAQFVNDTALSCVAPRHYAAAVPLEVALNGLDFSASGVLFEFEGLGIARVRPDHGPVAGGTTVVLHVDARLGEVERYCRFGVGGLVHAAVLTPTSVECVAPTHPEGIVALALVAPGLGSATEMAQYAYHDELEVLGLQPSRALDSAMTPVFVRGRNFVNTSSLGCAFGAQRTNATYINNETLLCTAPYYSGAVHEHTSVPVRVTTNLQDYTSTAATLEYVPCPVGAFCPGQLVLPCPPGAFCDSHPGFNMTWCPAGTYQPESAQARCVPCPLGHYCPSEGLSAPFICPAGMLCSLDGLSYPDSLCPAGHFCPPGVRTLDPLSEMHLQRPLECPENVWCAAGTATNVSVIGDFSTPQPCLTGFVCYRGSDAPTGSGPCPAGYYCPPGSLPIACPPSNYCPSTGNIFPSLCPPGFYSNQEGRQFCIECPIGHICPVEGLRRPDVCPAGSVCYSPGLRVPSALCPPGYYCWEGTETADANAETVYRPYPCARKTYCLGGVSSNETNEEDFNAPQPCPLGQYCLEASTSPFGYGRCPPGHYCPKGTSDPIPAPAGYFCKGEGNSQASPCMPGSFSRFNPVNGTDECELCPGGYTCENEGTYLPRPCVPGYFRTYNSTVACELCNEGSWNPYYANPAESLCLPCPPGRVCGSKGMFNLSQSTACQSGYICDWNTTGAAQFDFPCPAGYYCATESTPSHLGCAAGAVMNQRRVEMSAIYNASACLSDESLDCKECNVDGTRDDGKTCYCPIGLCPAGFICETGTRLNERERVPCEAGFYCPEGTSNKTMVEDFRCPLGTTSDPGATSAVGCKATGGSVIDTVSETLLTDNFFNCEPRDSERCDASVFVVPTQRHIDLDRRRQRRLAEAAVASYARLPIAAVNSSAWTRASGADGDSMRGLALSVPVVSAPPPAPRATKGPLRWDRYTLDTRSDEAPLTLRKLSELPELPPLRTFKLPQAAMATINADFSQISSEFGDMKYGKHYRVAIYVDQDAYTIPYPNSFWLDAGDRSDDVAYQYGQWDNEGWSKRTPFQLALHAHREITFRVELQILHGLFAADAEDFIGTVSLDFRLPSRADRTPGLEAACADRVFHDNSASSKSSCGYRIFLIWVREDSDFALPYNKPRVRPSHYRDEHTYDEFGNFVETDFVTAGNKNAMIDLLVKTEENDLPIYLGPLEHDYAVNWGGDDYWHEFASVYPYTYLPYFSKCYDGHRLGVPVDEVRKSMSAEAATSGGMTNPSIMPVRQRPVCNRSDVTAEGFVPQPGEVYAGFYGGGCPVGRRTVEFNSTQADRNLRTYANKRDTQHRFLKDSRRAASDSGVECDESERDHEGMCPYPSEWMSQELPSFDAHLPLFWAMENPDACFLVREEDTHVVNEFDWFSEIYYSDVCDYVYTCMYEEHTDTIGEKPYWFQAFGGDVLFYVSRRPIDVTWLEAGYDAHETANPNNFDKIAQLDLEELGTRLSVVRNSVPANRYPQRMQLTVKYWQQTLYEKMILSMTLAMEEDFELPNNDPSFLQEDSLRGWEYDLRITVTPCDWLFVMDSFSLSSITYMMFYGIIGFGIQAGVVVIWLFFRMTTRRANPPKVNFMKWVRGFEWNPLFGVLLAVLPILAGCVWIGLVLRDLDIFGNIPGTFELLTATQTTKTPEAVLAQWRNARIGVSIMVMGLCIINYGTYLLVPRVDKPGSLWKPGFWQRKHCFLTAIWTFLMLLVVLQISFTRFFSENANVLIFGLKAFWILMESVYLRSLSELLLILPFQASLQLTQFTMTLGADKFTSFVTVFVTEMLVGIIKRLVEPIKFRTVRLAKFKKAVIAAQAIGRAPPVMTPEIEATGILGDMLKALYFFAVEMLGLTFSVVVTGFLYLFRKEYNVADLYGIRSTDLLFYMLFTIIIIPFQVVINVLVHNILELVYNWKLWEYVQFCHNRFKNRTRRWMGLDPHINESLPQELRSLDQMCMSEQMYFTGAFFCGGIMMSVLGMLLTLKASTSNKGASTNPTQDPLLPLLAIIMVAILRVGKLVFIKLADKLGVWLVPGEKENAANMVYDEGPGARRGDSLPAGMAAVDAAIAECVEDALAAGHTDDTLVKLLSEAVYIPPGMSIQPIDGSGGQVGESQLLAKLQSNPQLLAQLQAQGTLIPGGSTSTALSTALVPPPPDGSEQPLGDEHAFEDFMHAFRREVEGQRAINTQLARYAPTGDATAASVDERRIVPSRARQSTALADLGASDDPMRLALFMDDDLMSDDDDFEEEGEDDLDEWPDEMLVLGLAVETDGEGGGGNTSSTLSTSATDDGSEGDTQSDESEDAWPVELVF